MLRIEAPGADSAYSPGLNPKPTCEELEKNPTTFAQQGWKESAIMALGFSGDSGGQGLWSPGVPYLHSPHP